MLAFCDRQHLLDCTCLYVRLLVIKGKTLGLSRTGADPLSAHFASGDGKQERQGQSRVLCSTKPQHVPSLLPSMSKC